MKGLVLIFAFIHVAIADFPFDLNEIRTNVERNDDVTYRLTDDIQPVHYDIEMTPYFEDTGDKEAFSFDGTVQIEVTVEVDGLTEIVLQDNVRSIEAVTLRDANNNPVSLDVTSPVIRERELQFLRIRLAEGITLVNGATYHITIVYIGNINETPLTRGVFRGSYVDENGVTKWYAASHLQPYHARQAFPSFDEPGFKSTFGLHVYKPAHFGQTYSNMPIAETQVVGERVKESFYNTPRMSAYLFTVHISEDFSILADNNNSTRSFRVIGRPNAQGQGDYALSVGEKVTEWMEDYFGIPYYDVAEYMKNDQIAVPDWASGATENWGLVSYRERILLLDLEQASTADKLSISTIIAHELAHKWFGNYITTKWWDNVWINEGFASYFEYHAITPVQPELETDDIFVISYVHTSFSSDASSSIRPLNDPSVDSRDSVSSAFGTITYAKGSSLLRMLRHMIGDETFRKALNYFLISRQFNYAVPEDVYTSFQQAVNEDTAMNEQDITISEFMRVWIDEPGMPVLYVSVDMSTGEMTLNQERYATTTEQIWPIPLTYTSGTHPNWDDTTPVQIMTDKSLTLKKDAGHEWVIFNIKQTALYRVMYDDHNWDMIAAALLNNIDSIHYLNRAQIVDDVFRFMRSGHMTYTKGFNILQFLKNDISYYPWSAALSGFSWYRARFSYLPEKLAEFDALQLEFMETVLNHLGYDVNDSDSTSTKLSRFYLMNTACNIEHKGCIDSAAEKFAQMKSNGIPVNPDIRRHVFCTGIRHGDTSDFEWLYNRFLESNSATDKQLMLRTLGCTSNRALIFRYLDLLYSDQVKAQERLNGLSFILTGSNENSNSVLEYFKLNYNNIRERSVTAANFNSVIYNIGYYLNEEGLDNFEEWLSENQSDFPESVYGLQVVNTMRTNLQWATDNADVILSAVRGGASITKLSLILIIFATFINVYC